MSPAVSCTGRHLALSSQGPCALRVYHFHHLTLCLAPSCLTITRLRVSIVPVLVLRSIVRVGSFCLALIRVVQSLGNHVEDPSVTLIESSMPLEQHVWITPFGKNSIDIHLSTSNFVPKHPVNSG